MISKLGNDSTELAKLLSTVENFHFHLSETLKRQRMQRELTSLKTFTKIVAIVSTDGMLSFVEKVATLYIHKQHLMQIATMRDGKDSLFICYPSGQ